MSASADYVRTEDGCFQAPLVVAYPYSRTVGTTLSHFFTELAAGRLVGTVGDDGSVFCPPAEFDPHTGAPLTEWAEVGPAGTVRTWTWQASPGEGQPLDEPFAWALIQLDGASGEILHAVRAASAAQLHAGARVTARWRAERGNGIVDIECFELADE